MPRVLKLLMATCTGSALVAAGLAQVGWNTERLYAAEHTSLLIGTVTSPSGEKVGGVTVSARRAGQAITASVFTDGQGRYYFPPLENGSYHLWAQAVGWDTADRQVDLKGSIQQQDLVLKETKDFVAQLSGDQLVAALPEDTAAHRRMKAVFVGVCTECHAANMALQNRFDAQGWEAIIIAMSRIGAMNTFGERRSQVISHFQKDLTAYLTEMRGPGPSPMKFPVPPRPTGDALVPVVYEYDLPFEVGGGYVINNGSDWSLGYPSASGGGFGLHDATVDFNGNIWFTYNDSETVTRTVGKIDTKTGRVTNFKYTRPGSRAATSHGIYTAHDGTIWFTVNLRAPGQPGSERLGKIDPRTDLLEVFTPPAGMRGMTIHVDEDGHGQIWGDTATGAVRFNPKTGEFREFKSLTQPGSTYGATGDRDGNGWWTQIGIDVVGHADVRTGKVSEITLPSTHVFLQPGDFSAEDVKAYMTRGRGMQGPRRPASDKKGSDVWVPNYSGNNLMRINIETMKTTFYPAPRTGLNPYMAATDSSHNVWVSFQGGDQVGRFNPKTEQWTLYSWPSRGTGLRNLSVVEHEGVVQVVGAYFNGARVGRIVMRGEKELQAIRTRVQEASARAQR